jgi:RNA-directed DNA polymerase
MLAQLSTFENILPQGAPTSPIISNFICRNLDRNLLTFAKQNRCFYSRYADDLLFSSSVGRLPIDVAHFEYPSGEPPKPILGAKLRSIIESSGFQINEHKLSLRGQNTRQLATGLVVNRHPNVPRQYIRQLRSMLHVWKRFAHDVAAEHFLTSMDWRNRVIGPPLAMFRYIVQGRIQYVDSVKGWNDAVYQHLAAKLAALDNAYKPKMVTPSVALHLSAR